MGNLVVVGGTKDATTVVHGDISYLLGGGKKYVSGVLPKSNPEVETKLTPKFCDTGINFS